MCGTIGPSCFGQTGILLFIAPWFSIFRSAVLYHIRVRKLCTLRHRAVRASSNIKKGKFLENESMANTRRWAPEFIYTTSLIYESTAECKIGTMARWLVTCPHCGSDFTHTTIFVSDAVRRMEHLTDVLSPCRNRNFLKVVRQWSAHTAKSYLISRRKICGHSPSRRAVAYSAPGLTRGSAFEHYSNPSANRVCWLNRSRRV
jgi:hypothetical protein